jgi:FkbM family methyltransferase
MGAEIQKPRSWSQNNEQEIIVAELNRLKVTSGRFLDIGAWDGQTLSNTYYLTELGWSGVCVEGSPTVFPGLLKIHGSNPKITLVNAVVEVTGHRLAEWFDSNGDAVSTISPAHMTKWSSAVKFTSFWVFTTPMRLLFDNFGHNFDLINIDVEGTNLGLFNALPWPQLNATKVVCVEHDGHNHEMEQTASKWGFHRVGFNSENLILSR